jgi:diadenosine tetraphosphate (Ap4A) HIT family hydrolase
MSMGTLRIAESEERYQKVLRGGVLKQGCPLCSKKPIKLFAYWKIIHNDFPYDKIADIHDMIVPLRHANEQELSDDERTELERIKKEEYLQSGYEYMIESTRKKKSVPAHFHLHLIVAKD